MFHLFGNCIFSVYVIWRGFNGGVVMSYKDQFTKAVPMLNVLNTMHEWTEFEIDNGIQISPEVAENAEHKACCVVASAFIRMKNND